MTTSVLQDSMASSPSSQGPRFRPYASPAHQVTKGRYITSNDPRGYIPVYEYPLNGQWIMMDIDDGYILWTGIWKALGNSKADIVKMLDSQPDLAPLIRRVRGGYLKIQGTWMPYEVALRLSRRVAYPIRDDLIPLFGPTFPSTCLSPDQPGYGQVVSTGSGRRRARRNTQPVAPIASAPPRERRTSWAVVTGPGANGSPGMPYAHGPPSSHGHLYPSPPMYHPSDAHAYSRGHAHPPSTWRNSPTHSPSLASIPSSSHMTNSPTYSRERSHARYSPYPGQSSTLHRRHSGSSGGSPHLDARGGPPVEHRRLPESIILPPIQPTSQRGGSFTQPPYALPPISTLEHSRGARPSNSAEVLRRLKMDDESNSEDERRHDESSRSRPHSASMYKSSSSDWPSAAALSRSHQDRPPFHHSDRAGKERSANTSLFPHREGKLNLAVPSSREDYDRDDGDSTCDPSPVSPETPHDRPGLVPLSILKERGTIRSPTSFPGAAPLSLGRDWASDHRTGGIRKTETVNEALPRSTDARLSACRHSVEEDESDDESTGHPLRPW